MHLDEPIRMPLLSHPGSILTLPKGSQPLIPRAQAASRPLSREHLLARIQQRLRQERATTTSVSKRESWRVLLLLPDKTRRQTAARLTVDALLDLCAQEPGWSVDIVFGLGTHPLMQAQEIEEMLGPERLRRLEALGRALHQQSTLASLPLRSLTVAAPRPAEAEGETRSAGDVRLEVPEVLWQHDMIVVAGDTDLHPYEGRGGSGGIHKMIAIGIGCLSAIRITHSMEILTHPQTRPGEAKNHFVETVDHFARSIIGALMQPSGSLRCAPLGISVVAKQPDKPDAFWIGNHEEERAVLLEELKLTRSLEIDSGVNLVVADTEPEKATDLLAGARSLHFLCSYDGIDNPLLCQDSACITAIMFNACHQLCNAKGIGNKGTVLHLEALRTFALEALSSSPESEVAVIHSMPGGTSSAGIGRALKARILSRWERYLNLVSKEDEVFAQLEQSLLAHGEGTTSLADVLKRIDEALPNSFGPHRHILAGIRGRLLGGNADSALLFLRETLDTLGFKGLGEGGQRALRLLTILRKFDQLLVATENRAVLDFLGGDQLCTEEGEVHPTSEPARVSEQPVSPFALVGLLGISLQAHTPQQCLDLAIQRHLQIEERCKTAEPGTKKTPLRLAFLQEPVILRRSRIAASSNPATNASSTQP